MKVQTAFRFDEDLIDILKEKAKAQRRSLNNYIETLLYKEVGNIPNDLTIRAIKDARENVDMSEIEDLEAYKQALLRGDDV